MKNSLSCFYVSVPLMAISWGIPLTVANGAEFNIMPRIVVGMMNYNYQENYRDGPSTEWHDRIPIVGTGVSLTHEKFDKLSLDFYAQLSDTGEDGSFEEFPVPAIGGKAILDKNVSFRRFDYAITAGYRITDSLFYNGDSFSVSVGYKGGQTTISNLERRANPLPKEGFDLSYQPQEIEYNTSGPAVAVSYGLPIGQTNTFVINAGFTLYQGDYKNSNNPGASITGDAAKGKTLGIKWNGRVTNHLTYGVSADFFDYQLDAAETAGNSGGSSLNAIGEKVLIFRTSLGWEF